MESYYKKSRLIIAALSVIIWYIMLINEDPGSRMFLIIIFTTVAYLFTFLGIGVSKKMINYGDNIAIPLIRFLYYFIALPALIFGLFYLVYFAMESIMDTMSNADLSLGILALIIVAIITVFMIVPYIQSIIIVILRKIERSK